MNEIDSSNQESVMKRNRKKSMGGAFTRPKGKQVAGQRYKSTLTPMAVSGKSKKRKTIRYKKSAVRK
jgi:hypothetical protein